MSESLQLNHYYMAFDEQAGRVLKKPLFWIKYDEVRDALGKTGSLYDK